MFIVIDRERLCVIYKHENQAAIVNLANIECPESAIVAISATDPDSYGIFTDFELKTLFYNICGQMHTGYNRPFLLKSVLMLIGLLPETECTLEDVNRQYDAVAKWDQCDFEYEQGSIAPFPRPEGYMPPALTSVAGYTPTHKLYYVPDPRQRVFKPVAGVNPLVPLPSTPAYKRDPDALRSTEIPVAPKEGSKTRRVWEIADKCLTDHTTMDKILRNLVATACENEGINSSTMSVQFSKWKQAKLNGSK